MLPDTRQVGEPQIDHLNLLVLDRLEDIFDRDTIRNHGFTPATESGVLKVTLPFDPSSRGGSGRTTPRLRNANRPRCGMAMLAFKQILSPASRQLQLWCGPRISFMASSICRQSLASSTSPFASRSMAFCAASAIALAPCASSNCRA